MPHRPAVTDDERAGAATMAAVQENLRSHASHLHHLVPGATTHRLGPVELADSGLHHDTFNTLCLASWSASLDATTAERCAGLVRGTGRPFSFWALGQRQVDDARRHLPRVGFVAAESEAVMTGPVPEQRWGATSGLSVEVVETPEGVAEYAELLAHNWTPPARDVARFLVAAAGHLTRPGSRSVLVVGRHRGRVVSGAEVHLAGGVAGLYGVATLEAHRGRGHASTIVSAALGVAASRGYARTCLQATEAGAGIYERLGYRRVDVCQEYAFGPSA
ncbi:GNAT family N-acetyltransferase [Nocardioides sp. SYSU D00038]|uniref:GNAT family N-acetyltransferase n=1 Tax=Nocardioides sp. SYSU D00038 TaxID=2812554 RepID=UPI0019679D2E|nr:GNAT family N-acetyltransferase [Nocardioides sp. SYSU D00038]